jgi:hypothetical protein
MTRLPLLLNTEPILGIRHTQRSRGHADWQAFQDDTTVVQALQTALDLGVDTILSVSDDRITRLLERLPRRRFTVLAVVPNLYDEARLLNEQGPASVVAARFRGVGAWPRLAWMGETLAVVPRLVRRDPLALLHHLFALDLLRFHRVPLSGVVLAAPITDTALAAGGVELLERFVTWVRTRYRVTPILATRNFGWLVRTLRSRATMQPTLLAPFNSQGLMMHPDQAACEVELAGYVGSVLADERLGDGLVEPAEAFRYLSTRGGQFEGAVVGVRPARELAALLTAASAT